MEVELTQYLRDLVVEGAKFGYNNASNNNEYKLTGYQERTITDLLEQGEALVQQEIAKAFEQGRKVGQYQTAETLYGDVTNIYLFKDGGTIKDLKLKQNADDHARELLKDCERYMNENSRAYADYIRTLKEDKVERR